MSIDPMSIACAELSKKIAALQSIDRPNYSKNEIIKKGRTLYIVKRARV